MNYDFHGSISVADVPSGEDIITEAISKVLIQDYDEENVDEAFANCLNLKSVKLPDSLKVIEKSAFHNCKNLETVELGKKLEWIKDFAFRGCENLKEIHIPEHVHTTGKGMFRECKRLEKNCF